MKLNINPNPYNQRKPLFTHDSIAILPGLVFVVGCNGSGKSALLSTIEDSLSETKEVLVLKFSPILDAGESTGEMYSKSFSLFLDKVQESIQVGENNKIFVLADVSQSGMTADVASQFKIRLFSSILSTAESKAIEIYILIAASDFEFVSDQECIDVQTFNRLRFNNYSSYKKYLLNSQLVRDKRYKKMIEDK